MEIFKTGLITLVCSGLLLAAKAQQSMDKIQQVERHLTPNVDFVFADSAKQQYSIIERMNYYGVPSVSIAVIDNGKVAWTKAYGLADVSTQRKVDANTLYQAASLSKTVNAALILKLVQQGKLDLDKDVRGYLKTWTFLDNELSQGKPITLRALLSHTAGMNLHGFKGYDQKASLPDINAILDGKSPANTEAVKAVQVPGTKQEYSGGGILVSQKVVEDQISQDYNALVKRIVFNALKMTRSVFTPSPTGLLVKNLAYAHDLNKKLIEGDYMRHPEGAPDALWATSADYARLVVALQNSIQHKKDAWLDASTSKAMMTPVLGNAALGFFILDKGGELYFTHQGANVGFRSIFFANMTTGQGVVIFVNSDNGQIMEEIANSVALAYGWKNFYAPEVKRLVTISSNQAGLIAGVYESESPVMKVRVRVQDGFLELNTRADDKRFERMYATGPTTFFLKSSPSTIIDFKGVDDQNPDRLEVSQGGKVVITAKKHQ